MQPKHNLYQNCAEQDQIYDPVRSSNKKRKPCTPPNTGMNAATSSERGTSASQIVDNNDHMLLTDAADRLNDRMIFQVMLELFVRIQKYGPCRFHEENVYITIDHSLEIVEVEHKPNQNGYGGVISHEEALKCIGRLISLLHSSNREIRKMLEKLKDENCSKRTEVFEEFMKDDHSISELAYKYDGGEQHLKAKNKRRWFFELLFPVCEDVNIRDNEDLEKVFNVNVRLFKYAQASVLENLNFLQKYCKKPDLLRYIPEKVCKKKIFLENVLWQMIKEAPEVMEYMPSDLVADEVIVTDGCRHNPDIFKYVNISLKNDFALVKKLSGISPKIVDYSSNEVKRKMNVATLRSRISKCHFIVNQSSVIISLKVNKGDIACNHVLQQKGMVAVTTNTSVTLSIWNDYSIVNPLSTPNVSKPSCMPGLYCWDGSQLTTLIDDEANEFIENNSVTIQSALDNQGVMVNIVAHVFQNVTSSGRKLFNTALHSFLEVVGVAKTLTEHSKK